MLDKKTEQLLDKIAALSTGMSQYKKRTVKRYEKKPGTGAAVGGGLGLTAGHLVGKTLKRGGNVARLLGLAGGALAGYGAGQKGSYTKTKTIEGVVKKQQKSDKAEIPKLDDKSIMKMLGR